MVDFKSPIPLPFGKDCPQEYFTYRVKRNVVFCGFIINRETGRRVVSDENRNVKVIDREERKMCFLWDKQDFDEGHQAIQNLLIKYLVKAGGCTSQTVMFISGPQGHNKCKVTMDGLFGVFQSKIKKSTITIHSKWQLKCLLEESRVSSVKMDLLSFNGEEIRIRTQHVIQAEVIEEGWKDFLNAFKKCTRKLR